MYAVIMASGTGTRLWPLSRKDNPKQFHSLITEKTLLRETFDRVNLKFPIEKIFVLVTKNYLMKAKTFLPELSDDNFIVEPFATGTASGCGLAAEFVNHLESGAPLVCIPSDHLIKDELGFVATMNYVEKVLDENPRSIVQIGIKPDAPDTGMGYIQIGEKVETNGNNSVFQVKRFVEKPDTETAKKYLESGEYLWNAGIYSFRSDFILEMTKKFIPDTAAALSNIAARIGQPDFLETADTEYKKIENISIDYGIAEKMTDILVVPADFGWSDIGSWGVLLEALSKTKDVRMVSRGHHIDVGSEDCLVMASDKLIATVGLKDIVIIDTPDVTLVCNKNKSQEIKGIIEKLKEQNKEEYL